MCYFSNDSEYASIVVDKKTNDIINNEDVKKCFLIYDCHNYRTNLTYDKHDDYGYHY
jgi:hypothetical protein